MLKKLLLPLFLLLSSCHYATASQCIIPNTYSTNGQLTNVNLNSNFQEPCSVMNGNLDNTNANTSQGYRFYQTVGALPSAGNQGAVYYLTTDNSLNFDTGSTFIKTIAPSGSPSQGNVLIYGASGLGYTTTGTYGAALISNGSGASPTFAAPPYVKVSNTQTQGTGGGSSTSGSWQTYPLNTKDNDSGSIATLSSNQITLPDGTYNVTGFASFYTSSSAQLVQIRIYNNTTSATALVGANAGNYELNTDILDPIQGQIILSGTSTLILQYQVETSSATNGLGQANNYGPEVYAVLEFWKVA